ncbi:rhodanese-like domain-containing protein [Phocaeicola sp.]
MKDLGAMSPEKALEYMKTTENLVIVDVASRTNYARKHFERAVNIPIENLSSDEEKELYLKLPKGRPVILHCRLGMIVLGAYRTLKQLRPDIPEISYIDDRPPFDEYNEWVKSKK